MSNIAEIADNQGMGEAKNTAPVTKKGILLPTVGPMRPATLADVDQAHAHLMNAVGDSLFYSDRFKKYEQGRLTKQYLRNLIAVDPHHVLIIAPKGKTIGVMISGPQYGTLWLYWSYVAPEFRRATLVMKCLRSFIEHWDNGRYHKISTYTRPGNDVATALMKRYKFDLTCVLKNHLFGEAYNLYERPLNKIEDGYDDGLNIGWIGQVKQNLVNLFRRD